MLLAWAIEKAERCPDCGTYYEEWDPEKGGHVHAYFPQHLICLGCKAKEDAYVMQKENSGVTEGLQMSLIRNPDAQPIRSPLTHKPIHPK